MAAGTNGIFAVWTGAQGLMARTPAHREPVKLSDHGAFPSVAGLADGTGVAAWEQDGRIAVERLH